MTFPDDLAKAMQDYLRSQDAPPSLTTVMRFTDGSTAIVAAWKREGHALQMNVDLSPNAHPQTDGGTHRRHV